MGAEDAMPVQQQMEGGAHGADIGGQVQRVGHRQHCNHGNQQPAGRMAAQRIAKAVAGDTP